MKAFAAQASKTTKTSTILQRIAERDKTVVKDCIDVYGNFIWALARKFTGSTREAEAVTKEIFIDIWQYRERERHIEVIEKKLIAMIALRRLIKPLGFARQKSMPRIDAMNEQGAGTDRVSKSV